MKVIESLTAEVICSLLLLVMLGLVLWLVTKERSTPIAGMVIIGAFSITVGLTIIVLNKNQVSTIYVDLPEEYMAIAVDKPDTLLAILNESRDTIHTSFVPKHSEYVKYKAHSVESGTNLILKGLVGYNKGDVVYSANDSIVNINFPESSPLYEIDEQIK